MSCRVQIDELKGTNASELRTQVDLLLYQALAQGAEHDRERVIGDYLHGVQLEHAPTLLSICFV